MKKKKDWPVDWPVWPVGRRKSVHCTTSNLFISGPAYITIFSWPTNHHVNDATERRANGIINKWIWCSDSSSHLTNNQNPPIHIQRLLSKQTRLQPDRFALQLSTAPISASNSPICYSASDSLSRPRYGDIRTRALQWDVVPPRRLVSVIRLLRSRVHHGRSARTYGTHLVSCYHQFYSTRRGPNGPDSFTGCEEGFETTGGQERKRQGEGACSNTGQI